MAAKTGAVERCVEGGTAGEAFGVYVSLNSGLDSWGFLGSCTLDWGVALCPIDESGFEVGDRVEISGGAVPCEGAEDASVEVHNHPIL